MNGKDTLQFVLNETATRTQYGALCWRILDGAFNVLLVTSRDTGRWIIPKGWPINGLTPEAAALREAREEAGVVGHAHPDAIGLYAYDKIMEPARAIPCMVAVYPVQVTKLRRRFPEQKERQRRWFAPKKAAARVEEPDLRLLLGSYADPADWGALVARAAGS